MKGMLSFLERTGFVRSTSVEQEVSSGGTPDPAQALDAAPAAPIEQQLGLSLAQIYAQAGVGPSNYSAEKLLRLLEGLKMMDEATRRTAVQAMDAADDGWTIEDPVRDAMAKAQAINDYGAGLRAGVEHAEQETAAQLAQVKDAEAATVTDIRRQIADLEGLMSREIARSAQEQAALQSSMQAKREAAARQIEQLTLHVNEMRRLIAHFGGGSQVPAAAGDAAA